MKDGGEEDGKERLGRHDENHEDERDVERVMECRVMPQLVEVLQSNVVPLGEMEQVDLLEGENERLDDGIEEPIPEECRGRCDQHISRRPVPVLLIPEAVSCSPGSTEAMGWERGVAYLIGHGVVSRGEPPGPGRSLTWTGHSALCRYRLYHWRITSFRTSLAMS